MDSAVTIYVKLKPEEKSEVITISRDQGEIRFQDSKSHVYNFSRIFPQNVSIQEIFDTTTKPLINFLKGGISSVVLAYGHKKTGKRECIFGDQGNGIFPLIIENLLEYSQEMLNTKEITISLSVVELLDENVRDLGYGYSNSGSFEIFEKNLEIKEGLGKVFIADASVYEIQNSAEAMDILNQSLDFRRDYEAKTGEYADRANTFVLIYLKQKNKGSN